LFIPVPEQHVEPVGSDPSGTDAPGDRVELLRKENGVGHIAGHVEFNGFDPTLAQAEPKPVEKQRCRTAKPMDGDP
jgi:hypothetical protein